MHDDSICPDSEDEAAGITERANGGSKIGSREHFITEGPARNRNSVRPLW
jgi:hypothetical protein